MIHTATSPITPDRSKPSGVTIVTIKIPEGTLCRVSASEDQCELTMAFDNKATKSLALALEKVVKMLRSAR